MYKSVDLMSEHLYMIYKPCNSNIALYDYSQGECLCKGRRN